MSLALLLLLVVASGAAAEPHTSWMYHIDQAEDGTYSYLPERLEVVPGAPIELMIFGEGTQHGLVSDTGAWPDVTVQVPPGRPLATGTFDAPMTPGEYPFHDPYHEGLTGVLVVVGPDAPKNQSPGAPLALTLGLIALATFARKRR